MSALDKIKLGEAFVKIGADSTRLKSDLEAATGELKSFSVQATNLATNVAIGWGACQAAVVAVTAHFASVGDQLDKMSQRTGISAKSLSALSYAAGQCGASIEELEGLMFPLSEKILNGDDNFKKLGISIEYLQGLNPEMQFMAVADALSRLESKTQQAAVATAMFGGDGEKLLPLLQQGASGINALKDKASELGLVLDESAVTKAAAMTDAFDNITKATTSLSVNLGAVLAPIVTGICNDLAQVIGAFSKWTKENELLSSTLAVAGKNILLVSGSILGMYGAAKACASVYYTLYDILKNVYGAIANGVTAVIESYKAYEQKTNTLKAYKAEATVVATEQEYLNASNAKNTAATTASVIVCKGQIMAEAERTIAINATSAAMIANSSAQKALTVVTETSAVAAKDLAISWQYFVQSNPAAQIVAVVSAMRMYNLEIGSAIGETNLLQIANEKNAITVTASATACKLLTVAETTNNVAVKTATKVTVAQTVAQKACTIAGYAGSMAVKALNAAWSFFMSTNPIGWIMAVVAALGALTAYLVGGESAVTQYSRAMEKAKEKGDDLRKTHELYANRIEELNKKERLSSKEKGELITIVAELNRDYSGLGLQVDKVTGKVTESSHSVSRLRDTMKEAAATQLSDTLRALNDELAELQSKLDAEGNVGTGRAWGTWLSLGYMDNADEINDKINEIKGKIEELKREKITTRTQEIKYSEEYINAEKKVAEWREKEAVSAMSEYEKRRYAISQEMNQRRETLTLLIEEMLTREKLSTEEKALLAERRSMLKALDSEQEKRIKSLNETIRLEEEEKNKATAEEASQQLATLDEQTASQNRSESERKIYEIKKEFEERKKLLQIIVESQQKRKDLDEKEKADLEAKKKLLADIATAEQQRIDAMKKAESDELQAERDAESKNLAEQFASKRQSERDKLLDKQWRDMSSRSPQEAERVASRNAMEYQLETREQYKKMQRLIDTGASEEAKESQRKKIEQMESELATWKNRRDDLAIARVSNARNTSFSQPTLAIAGTLEAQRKFLENQQANKKTPMEELGIQQVNWLEKIFRKQDELNNNFDFGEV